MRRNPGDIQRLLISSSLNLVGSPPFLWHNVSPMNEEMTGLWAMLLEAAAIMEKPHVFFFVPPVSSSGA